MELVDREDLDSDPGSYQSISRGFIILMRMNYQLYDSSTNIMVLMSGFYDLTRVNLTSFAVPLAILFGFVFPTVVGYYWGDPIGACIWGGLVSRLASECVSE